MWLAAALPLVAALLGRPGVRLRELRAALAWLQRSAGGIGARGPSRCLRVLASSEARLEGGGSAGRGVRWSLQQDGVQMSAGTVEQRDVSRCLRVAAREGPCSVPVSRCLRVALARAQPGKVAWGSESRGAGSRLLSNSPSPA